MRKIKGEKLLEKKDLELNSNGTPVGSKDKQMMLITL